MFSFLTLNIAKSTSVGINDNGTIITNNGTFQYGYSTNGLLGIFNFYNGSFYSANPNFINGYSLQLNANVNISLNTTLWVQSISRVIKENNTYKINFLDNVWNVTTSNSSISLINGKGSIYNNYYAYEFPITFTSITPFSIKIYDYIIGNSTYPRFLVYFIFENSTYKTNKILLDNITVNIKSRNPRFLIGNMGGFAPETVNSLYYPFVLQFVICGFSRGSQLFVYKWNSTMQLFYLYNNSWYFIPSAFQDSPNYYAGSVTLESVNQLDGINEHYNNDVIYQTQGMLNQTSLWIPGIKIINNSNNYILIFIPQTLWNVTIKNNHIENFRGNESNITLSHGYYLIKAILVVDNKPILTYMFNLTQINKSSSSYSFPSEIQSLLYLAIFVVILMIFASIIKRIKKYL